MFGPTAEEEFDRGVEAGKNGGLITDMAMDIGGWLIDNEPFKGGYEQGASLRGSDSDSSEEE